MNDPEDIFTVGPGMTLLEAYTKAIARVAELEAKIARYEAIPTLDDCIHMDRLEAVNKIQGANLRHYRKALVTIHDIMPTPANAGEMIRLIHETAHEALKG